MRTRSCMAALGALLVLTGSACAEVAPARDLDRWRLDWPPRLLPIADDGAPDANTGVLEGAAPAQQAIEADKRQRQVPSFRVEFSGRMMAFIDSRIQIGPNAHTIRVHRETHLPRVPQYGYRLLVDAQIHRDWLVGGYFSQLLARGGRRNIHRGGLSAGGNLVPRTAHGKTSIDLTLATAFCRYVVLDNDRVRLSWGVGVAFARYRFRFDGGPGARLDDKVDTYFGPTLDYLIQFRLRGPLYLYLESVFAVVAPAKLGSYVSEFRAGFRIALGGGLELLLALNSFSGSLDEYRDLWGTRRSSGHRYARASWTSLGGEIGVSLRF